jgi:uracil-DNA glycosylase
MTWTQQQRAMLAEMGVRVWQVEPEKAVAEPKAAQRKALEGRPPGEHQSIAKPPQDSLNHPEELAIKKASQPAPQIQIHTPVLPPSKSHMSTHAEVSQMHWPELRTTVAQCTACKLCENRTQTVFGVGSEQADWMVVGEAPGEQEDRQGEPFVGKSGQLLDNMLRAMGLGRGPMPVPEQQVFIANTIKCRPPANRNPLPEELAQCEPYLIRQVALIQPKIILAMGRFAVQSLLRRSDPIGRLRGQVHSYQGVPLIVTYHPAYLLRNPEDKAKAWDDLCLAMASYQQG